MTSETGPTIVLIGGPVTMDDGTELDSRQEVDGDDQSIVLTKSLAGSWLWWDIAASLVTRVTAGTTAGYALLIGPRTIATLQPDGALKRTRLTSLLPGATATLTVDGTTTELPAGDAPWRLLNGNPWYLSRISIGPSPPSAIVHTSAVPIAHAVAYGPFEGEHMLKTGAVLVMPHTAASDRLVRGYAEWLSEGRPARVSDSDPAWPKPRGITRYAHPIPIHAHFGVTGLMRDGRWANPSDLEAARALLQSRFDLKLGLWDLTDNAVLRSTLLKATPAPEPPIERAPLPTAATKRATALIKGKDEQLALAETRLANVAATMRPVLVAVGWEDHRLGSFHLPLTEPLERWPGETPAPALSLWLSVARNWTTVQVSTTMYNDIDVNGYLAAGSPRRSIEAISGSLPPRTASTHWIWRLDRGWTDTQTHWLAVAEDIASFTPGWAETFERLAGQCRSVLAARSAGRSGGLRITNPDDDPPA